jgi:hypothetical protein
MWDLLGISDPTPTGAQTTFDFGQKDVKDPSGLTWNFGSDQFLGNDYYKNLGYTGQAYTEPSSQSLVSGGDASAQMNPAFKQWLQSQGLTFGMGQGGGKTYYGYFDKSGKMVGQPVSQDTNPGPLWDAAMAAGFGALGGAALGGFGGGGTAGSIGSGAGAEGAAAADLAGGLLPEYGTTAAYEAGLAGAVPAAGIAGPGLGAATGTATGVGNTGLGGAAAGTAAGNVLGGGASGIGSALSGAPDYLKYLIPGLATLGGTYLQQKGISDAQNAQNNATAAANALASQNLDKILAQQKQIFDLQRQDQAPWMQAGQTALAKLTDIMGKAAPEQKQFSYQEMGDVTQTPGYQFGMNQGIQAIDRSAAARGGLLSGATLKAANRYGTDYATTKYRDFEGDYQRNLNNAFNRYITQQQEDRAGRQEQLDPLYRAAGYGTAGLGYANSAANNYGNATGNALSNYGQTVGNNIIGQGNAMGAAAVQRGNLYGNLLAQLGGLGYQYFGG